VRHVLLIVILAAMPAISAAEQDWIDEVFVTATRRPANLSEVSSALSLATSDTVRSQKLTTDALKTLVGVYVQQTTPGQGAAIIRGLKGSSVLHLVDGIRLNNAIFRSAPTQYLALVPTVAVERIEVIRGTPASLYGSEAVGGMVHIVSHKPSFESSTTEVRRDFLATIDTAELRQSLSATVDIGTKKFSSSISAEYQSTGDRRIGTGDRVSPSGYTSRAARIFLAATPTNEQAWTLDLQLLEQPETPRVDELVAGFDQDQPSSSEFYFAPNQRLFSHAGYSKIKGPLGLDWKLDAAWQRIVDDRTSRDFEATERILESNRSDLSGITLSANGDTDLSSWIIGAEIYYDQIRSSRIEENTINGERQDVAARFPDKSTVTQSAIYASMSRSLADQHLISGGLRYSYVNIDLPNTTVSDARSSSVNDLSGDVGWIYDVQENWQLLANIGFGFRAPNIFDLGTLGNRPGNRFNIPNIDLDSEHVWHGDVGVRGKYGRGQAELVIYSLKYDDRITSVLTGDVTPDGRDIVQSVNASRSSIRGIEAGFDVEVSDSITAHANLNYTWGEQRIDGDSKEPADRIPPLSARLSVVFNGGNWQLEGWINSAGSQDRLSARDVRDVRINPLGTAGWATIGARAYWSTPSNWHLTVSMENLLDRQYRQHGSGLDEPGRNLSVSIRRAW